MRSVQVLALLFVAGCSGPDTAPTLWTRVNTIVFVGNRIESKARVYRSPEGTLLVDMRDFGYLVQPYWEGVKSLPAQQYSADDQTARLRDRWPLAQPVAQTGMSIEANLLKFSGLDGAKIELHGRVAGP